jgi:hypothetical protein
MALQLRRGTDAERKLATFSPGEIIYTTDTKKVFVGDGSTLGGKLVGGIAEAGLRAVTVFTGGQFITTYETEYTADGHLKMNGKDVVGIRDLVVERRVVSNLAPNSTAYSLGLPGNPWGNVYANTITAYTAINSNVTGNITGDTTGTHYGSVRGGDLYGNVYSDSNRKLIDWRSESFDGIFQGPLYGSVYGNDSSVVLDSFAQVLKLAPRTSAPAGATVGMIAIADNSSWDPANIAGTTPYLAFYNGTAWTSPGSSSGSTATFTNATISGGSLTFSGNISAPAWTTSGIRHVSVAATLTDTTSTGTVADAYTNSFGGNTIAASNATTFTNYATVYLNSPTAGTNVTITNSYSLITAGSVLLGGNLAGTATQNVFNTLSTTVNAFGAATTLSIGAATGTASINNATVTLSNATTVNINGASPTLASTSTGTLTLFNTNLLTVAAFNAATTATLVNSATTLGIGNTATAAQTVNMFTASTGASTYNFATGATASATTKAINIGTTGVSGSTTNIALGSSVSGATSLTTINGAVKVTDVRDTVFAATFAATFTPDAANGSIQNITLTGNITISAFANPVAGQTITLILTQDATGSRTLTSTMKFAGGIKTLSTAAASIDMISITYTGSVYYASLVTGFA